MAATIDVKLKDNSKEWLAELKKNFIAGGGSAADFEKHIDSLNKGLSSHDAKRAADEIRALGDQYEIATQDANNLSGGIRRVGDALDTTGNSANNAGQNMRKAGSGFASNITALSTGAMALIATAKQLVEVARKAYQGISMMAETSPKFAELKTAIDDVGESIQKAARTFAATDFGAGAIDFGIAKLKGMGEGLEALPELWNATRTLALEAQLQVAEALGQNTDAIVKEINAIRDANAAMKDKVEAMKRQAEAAASQKIADAADAAMKKALDQDEFNRMVQKLNNQERIEKAIAKEKAARDELIKQGKFTEELAQQSVQRLLTLEQQKRKAIEDEIARQKELNRVVEEGERNKFLAIEARKDAEKAAQQGQIDKVKEAIGGGGSMGQQGPDVLGQLQGGIKPMAVRDRVIKDRQEKALQAWREQMQAEGKMDQNGILISKYRGTTADDGDGDRRDPARTRAQERAIRERARAQTRKDFNLGNVSNEEITTAGGELLEESAKNLMQSGKFDNTMVKALEQNVEALRQTREEKAALTDRVQQLQGQVNLLMGRGMNANQRAQMVGSGQ